MERLSDEPSDTTPAVERAQQALLAKSAGVAVVTLPAAVLQTLVDQFEQQAYEIQQLNTAVDRVKQLRARVEAADAVAEQAELTCAVIERVLDADASEGTPIWEWTEDEACPEVRKVLAAADDLQKTLGALVQVALDGGRGR